MSTKDKTQEKANQLAWLSVADDGKASVKAFGDDLPAAKLVDISEQIALITKLFWILLGCHSIKKYFEDFKLAAEASFIDFEGQKKCRRLQWLWRSISEK